MSKLNNKLRKARESLHISQELAAKFLGISKNDFIKIESGDRKVSKEELEKLCALFLIQVDELLNEIDTSKLDSLFDRNIDEEDRNEILNLIEFKKMKLKDNQPCVR